MEEIEEQKKDRIDWATIIIVILFIIFAVLIIFVIVSKDSESKNLKNKLTKLLDRKHYIENIKKNLDLYFKIAYNSVKFICIIILGGGIFLIWNSLKEKNIFEFASRFTDIFGAIGLLILLVCLFAEENPLDVFYLRSKLKYLLKNIIYGKHKKAIEELPVISNEIDQTKREIENND